MARERPWTVLPHDPIEKLEPNLWTVEGRTPMPLRRRAMIVRLSSGRLVLMNAVPLDEPAQKEIEAFGEPGFLIVPNGYHRLDIAAFKRRYPGLKVLCPAESEARVAERVAVDGHYDALPEGEGLRVAPLAGTKLGEAAFVVDSDGRSSVLFPGDALFNAPHQPGLGGLILRVMGSTGGPRVTPLFRMVGVRDAAALAGSLRELARLPGLTRILVCHGAIVARDPGAVLEAIADRLEGRAKAA